MGNGNEPNKFLRPEYCISIEEGIQGATHSRNNIPHCIVRNYLGVHTNFHTFSCKMHTFKQMHILPILSKCAYFGHFQVIWQISWLFFRI